VLQWLKRPAMSWWSHNAIVCRTRHSTTTVRSTTFQFESTDREMKMRPLWVVGCGKLFVVRLRFESNIVPVSEFGVYPFYRTGTIHRTGNQQNTVRIGLL
jgi:hypothetical protein